ncbi:hypothetical protein SORBI_3001G255200 [Sorghum bicolor]|uniref:Uncharacterized protein n=1 Tax=Sorghum bicolor TaxID=4558 RepID=A0A1B6QL06_SORBI|nr:hypothetical protein SORBI_3001G255200 [Sorghum bicolor]
MLVDRIWTVGGGGMLHNDGVSARVLSNHLEVAMRINGMAKQLLFLFLFHSCSLGSTSKARSSIWISVLAIRYSDPRWSPLDPCLEIKSGRNHLLHGVPAPASSTLV